MRLLLLPLVAAQLAADPAGPITYDNHPLGSPEAPLVLRTYLPDPGLDEAVFSQHDRGLEVSKYNPGRGRDVPGKEQPIAGIPAAIAVNFGPALSFAFDTTECRLLYAWQGGFLDMTPYWGDPQRGNRRSFDYVPRLVGTLFHQASGRHPVEIDGRPLDELGAREFIGYRLEKGVPRFEFRAGGRTLSLSLTPSETPLSLTASVRCQPPAALGWRGIEAKGRDGSLEFTLSGSELGKFEGFRRNHRIRVASLAAGQDLFATYGCIACHSLDGSKGHGPSLAGVAGQPVEIEGMEEPLVADRAYLLESIKAPNAKIVKGYPPNYMPPFTLPQAEYDSLILYLESLAQPE